MTQTINHNQQNVNNSSAVLAANSKLSEMSSVFSYEGNNVTMRLENGVVFVNLTEVAKAFPSKNLSVIVNSKEIQGYISRLTEIRNFSSADLLIVSKGGVKDQGTWAHQRVALRVAQKLSTDFAIWVDEKIEELLTTGRTSIVQKIPTNKELALMVIQAEEEKERLMLENKAQQEIIAQKDAQIEVLDEKSKHVDYVLRSPNTITTTVIAQDYGMSAKTMNKILHEYGVQYKQNETWVLYSKYKECGYVHSNPVSIENKETNIVSVKNHTVWTQKGRLFIYNFLKEKGVLPLLERKGVLE